MYLTRTGIRSKLSIKARNGTDPLLFLFRKDLRKMANHSIGIEMIRSGRKQYLTISP